MTPRLDARKAKQTKYEGLPCIHGHGTLRWTANGACVRCRTLQKARQYYEKQAKKTLGKPGRKRKHEDDVVPKKPQNPKNYYDRTTDIGKWIYRSKTGKNKKARKELLVDHYKQLIVSHCPLLGIRLSYENYKLEKMPDNYATLDRIEPNLGYVFGNVQIISYRANTIKNSATLEEMALIVKNWSAREKL